MYSDFKTAIDMPNEVFLSANLMVPILDAIVYAANDEDSSDDEWNFDIGWIWRGKNYTFSVHIGAL